MTELLEQAIAKVNTLSDSERDERSRHTLLHDPSG